MLVQMFASDQFTQLTCWLSFIGSARFNNLVLHSVAVAKIHEQLVQAQWNNLNYNNVVIVSLYLRGNGTLSPLVTLLYEILMTNTQL